MIGKLNKVDGNWVVEYPKHPTSHKIYETATLQLHPDDVKTCNDYGDYSVDWIGKEVKFDIVEVTKQHQYTNGEWARSYQEIKYAKLR
jgi:hypothetical protein